MSTAWQNNEMQLITVTLYEKGFERYLVEFTHEGKLEHSIVWAREREQVVERCQAAGYTEVRVSDAGRDKFWAIKENGISFIGKESQQMLYKVRSTGDWILWPEMEESK